MKKIVLLFLLVSCGKKISIVDHNFYCKSKPCQINKELVGSGNVSEQFDTTPDETKVVYIADEDTDGVNELYVADINSNHRRKLNLPISFGQNVTRFKISPNSQKVAYLADEGNIGLINLYTINLDGTEHYKVNINVPSSSFSVADTFSWMPDSTKLVYVSDEENSVGLNNLYIAQYNGTNRTTLHTSNVDSIFGISGNGQKIVFKVGSGVTLSNPIVKSINPDGTNPIMLNSPFNLGTKPASAVSSFVISPDSLKVVYRSNHDDDSKYELFAVNIDGTGSRIKINGVLPTGGNVASIAYQDYMITSDSNRVVYLADQNINNQDELYISYINGTGNVKLNSLIGIANGDIKSFKISGNKVIYLADKNIDEANELFVVNFDGTNELKINTRNLVATEKVNQYEVQGNIAVYSISNAANSLKSEIFSNNLSGSNEARIHSGIVSLANGGYDSGYNKAKQFKIFKNKVVFRLSQDAPEYGFYSSNIDGSELHNIHPLINGQNLMVNSYSFGTSFLILSNGTAVYRYSSTSGINLYSNTIN